MTHYIVYSGMLWKYNQLTPGWSNLYSTAPGQYGPLEMEGHAMCIEGDGIYIHGGYNGSILSYLLIILVLHYDFWRYNITTNVWTSLNITTSFNPIVQPPPLHDHAMTSQNGFIYIFGGENKNGFYNDLWRYQISEHKWDRIFGDGTVNLVKNVATQQIGGITKHAMAIQDDDIYVYGGYDKDTGTSKLCKLCSYLYSY